jgi:sugar lactone lactonase YvrE
MAIDAAGNVYVGLAVAYDDSSSIMKITPAGVSSTFVSFGSQGGCPYNLALDGAGNLYSTNPCNEGVFKVTPAGVVSDLNAEIGQSPHGIAIDAAGNIYTSIFWDSWVAKITPAGVATKLADTLGPGGGQYPGAIVLDAAGNVYTADSNDTGPGEYLGTVTKITPEGVASKFGTTGYGPVSIAIDAAGNIYTANYWSNDVSKITPRGVSSIVGATGLAPRAIVLDAAGNIYTANEGSSDITKITPDGGVAPTRPHRVRWRGPYLTSRVVTSTFAAVAGTRYTIGATRKVSALGSSPTSRTARGVCRVAASKQSGKRMATCTLRIRQAGTWRVGITPVKQRALGASAMKTLKIRAASTK